MSSTGSLLRRAAETSTGDATGEDVELEEEDEELDDELDDDGLEAADNPEGGAATTTGTGSEDTRGKTRAFLRGCLGKPL